VVLISDESEVLGLRHPQRLLRRHAPEVTKRG
jgi:hypothetical protein